MILASSLRLTTSSWVNRTDDLGRPSLFLLTHRGHRVIVDSKGLQHSPPSSSTASLILSPYLPPLPTPPTSSSLTPDDTYRLLNAILIDLLISLHLLTTNQPL
jgi:hypothetical protein